MPRIRITTSMTLLTLILFSSYTFSQTNKTIDETKPRLIMVKINNWKVPFYGLPAELPLLLAAGETVKKKKKHYDFSRGMEAMKVFLQLRPKDPQAKAYRLFLEKWPVYQKFYKAVAQQKYADARSLLETVLALDPKEPGVHFYLGSLNSQDGEYAQAEKNYRDCIRIFPDYGPAYINLAKLTRARKSLEETKQLLQMAMDRAGKTGQADVKKIAKKMLKSLK